MATPKSQRIGIWIIAIVLTIGTLGSFLVMGLSVNNQANDQAALQKANTEYQAEVTKRNEKVDIQAKELSSKYYVDFSQYAKSNTSFSADDVKTLVKTDLKIGDGAEIKSDTDYNAYYIGWNPKGVIFDQSIADGALKSPLAGGNMITGWNEGVIGMKMGGIRELSIPSKLAYDNVAKSEDIPANTPLKFIVMVIPKVAEIPQVTIPQILLDYYQSQSTSS